MLVSCALLASAQAPPIPFDEAGEALLDLAGKHGAKDAGAETRVELRLRPLHERLRLGGVELWIPKRVLDDRLVPRPGPAAKDVAAMAGNLVELQREWLDRTGAGGAELEVAAGALSVLERFARELRRFGERADVAQARVRVEELFFRSPVAETSHAPILILAPTRAQYIGAIGAAALLAPRERGRLCAESARRGTSASLAPRVSVIAWTTGRAGERASPLDDELLEPEEAHQNLVHAASHVLAAVLVPSSPAWFGEGLAIGDTIATLGADETLCTGAAELSAGSGYTHMGGGAGILLWVTRHKSPYRGGASARHFLEPLRAAWSREGFQVLDLDTVLPSYRVEPPLLGDGAGTPERVARGSDGSRKGFAELYRAYCAAVVHWMGRRELADGRSLLASLCSALSRIPYAPGQTSSPLYQLALSTSGSTLGVAGEENDLEAQFVAWLAAR
jgi:hypothetical protein